MDDWGNNENVQKKPVIEWCELEFFKGVRAKASQASNKIVAFLMDEKKKYLYTYISVKLGIWEILSYTSLQRRGFC